MPSDPAIRDRIFCALEEVRTVSGADVSELRRKLNMLDVSNTKFCRALGSMRYHHGMILWRRFWPAEFADMKHHEVTLRS